MDNIKKLSLAELLLALRRKINEGAKKHSLRQELTMSQFETLWFIGLSEKKTMESIADYLGIKPPSATIMIDKMAKAGLVKRTTDKKDRRIVWVVLTIKAKNHFVVLKRHKEAFFNKIIGALSKKDREDLKRILLKLTEK